MAIGRSKSVFLGAIGALAALTPAHGQAPHLRRNWTWST